VVDMGRRKSLEVKEVKQIKPEDITVYVTLIKKENRVDVDVYGGITHVCKLFEILRDYGFETFTFDSWENYDMSRESIEKMIKELKDMGYNVKYKEYND
jgi:dihydroorotase-like cyclic amidohydrolase